MPPIVPHLHDCGWIEGRNLIVESRFDEGKGFLSRLAAELVRLSPDVLIALGTPAALAAQGASSRIPIVIASVADPVASGLVASLARPGGNITGVSLQGPVFAAKALQLLKEALPTASRIAVLLDPGNPPQITQFNDQLSAAAQALHLTLKRFDVRAASDLDGIFAEFLSQPPHAVLAYPLRLTSTDWQRTIDFGTKHRLPMMTFSRAVVQAGALMYFFANVDEMYRQTASYVNKILRGAKPGDLPIEQPTRFELIINLKTAKALGLTIPPSLLAAGGPGDRVMDRRAFLGALGLLAAPLAAEAQQAGKVYRIGFLRAGQLLETCVEGFRQGLRERGYVDGQNVVVECRATDGSFDQLPRFAEELVRSKVDVILASAAPAALAARRVTTSVPIVFVGVQDPVELGLVPSLARPGGNITGLATNAGELAGKRLELLRAIIPRLDESPCCLASGQSNQPEPAQGGADRGSYAGRGACAGAGPGAE